MSGPWDRPSSPDPGGDWPQENADTPREAGSDGGERDPWSAADPWRESSSDEAPRWDEWPSPAPSPDAYQYDEPFRPSSDPWAESWTDDAPDLPPSPFDATPTESWSPPADRAEPRTEPWAPEPEPEPEPWSPEAKEEPEAEPEPRTADPGADASASDAGVAPDHSGAEPAAREALEATWTPIEPEMLADAPVEAIEVGPAAEPVDLEAAAEPMEVEDASEPATSVTEPPPPAPSSWTDRMRSLGLPDWLAEPVAEPEPEPEPQVPPPGEEPAGSTAAPVEPVAEPVSAPEPEPGPADLPVPEPPSSVEADAEAPEDLNASWLGAGAWRLPEPEPTVQPEPPTASDTAEAAFESEWSAAPAWRMPEAPVEPEPEPEPPAQPEPEPEPWAQADAEPEARLEPVIEPEPPSAEPEAFEAPSPEPPPAPRDRWETSEPEAIPEPDWGALAEPEAPAAEPESWQERPDSTQVLPTTWVPPAAPLPERTGELEPAAGPIRTTLRRPEAETEADAAPAPTTAEQVVPWLIGVILLLAGMVIVLLALIFAGDGSLGGGAPEESDGVGIIDPVSSVVATPEPTVAPTPAAPASSAPSADPTPTPIPAPEYGPLEIVFQGRSAALAPIYLLHRDFTVDSAPTVLAQDPSLDVRRFCWAPDGTVGAGLLSDVLVSIELGKEKRRLGDGLATVTFGADASTVYAVRVRQDGANDVATVLDIGFTSGETEELASVSYARPSIASEPALAEAQFADDGGPVRLYWMEDETLRLWILGGGAWSIDPAGGEVTELENGDEPPKLWSPNGSRHIGLEVSEGVTTISLLSRGGETLASTEATGLVSHLRWGPAGNRVVFTLGRTASGGGIVQDLFLWDLEDGVEPVQLTSTGAAFGAQWLGSHSVWRD